MTELAQKVFTAMFEYERGCPQRIQHFTKVHDYATLIGMREGLDEYTQELLEIAAITHDIGIKPALEKYGNAMGPNQEKEGAIAAKPLLKSCGVSDEMADRVCFIIGHHHTYSGVDGIDWQIILEADYFVNSFEGSHSQEQIKNSEASFFKTSTGKQLFETMYNI